MGSTFARKRRRWASRQTTKVSLASFITSIADGFRTTSVQNVPTGPDGAGGPGRAPTGLSNVPITEGDMGVGQPSAHQTAAPGSGEYLENRPDAEQKGSGLLSKLKPSKSSEKLKTTTGSPAGMMANVPTGEGPPVTGEVAPLATLGKDTRFSDTVHVGPGSGMLESISGKLKKRPSSGDLGAVGPGGGEMEDMSGVTTGVPPGAPILEEMILPDGRRAFVQKASPVSDPAGKNKSRTSQKSDIMEAADLNGPHCAMCCPTAPRDASGLPIYPCAHQDGVAGQSPFDAAKAAFTGSKNKKQPSVPGAEPLGLPEAGGDKIENDIVIAPGKGSSAKLKKDKGGPPLTPEEAAMEDVRKLASEWSLGLTIEAG